MQAVHQVFTSKAFPLRSTMCFNPLWACVYLLSNCKVTLNPYGRLECIFTPVVFLFISQQTFLFFIFFPSLAREGGMEVIKSHFDLLLFVSQHTSHTSQVEGVTMSDSLTPISRPTAGMSHLCVCVCAETLTMRSPTCHPPVWARKRRWTGPCMITVQC